MRGFRWFGFLAPPNAAILVGAGEFDLGLGGTALRQYGGCWGYLRQVGLNPWGPNPSHCYQVVGESRACVGPEFPPFTHNTHFW